RDAFGHQISQRPLRRCRRSARNVATRWIMGAHWQDAPPARHRARAVRCLAADAWHADIECTRKGAGGFCQLAGASARRPSGPQTRALSRPRAASRPRRGAAADERGLRRHVIDPRQRRRGGRHRSRSACRVVAARDLARRRRKLDRASRLHRRRGLALSRRPATLLRRPGRSAGALSRSRRRAGADHLSLTMSTVAVAIVCKTPTPGKSKTRLSPPLRPEECAALSACFIRDLSKTIQQVADEGGVTGYAVYTPRATEPALRALLPERFRLMPQGEGDLGARLLRGTEDLLAAGHAGAVLVNSDSPTLPASILRAAADAVRRGDNVVLSPALDGGYTLI